MALSDADVQKQVIENLDWERAGDQGRRETSKTRGFVCLFAFAICLCNKDGEVMGSPRSCELFTASSPIRLTSFQIGPVIWELPEFWHICWLMKTHQFICPDSLRKK